jgi:predicted transcriptional regulator
MNRSKQVIIWKILKTCKIGSTKTRIVYQANLNFKTAIPYIDLLIKNDFLETVPGKNVLYKTTDKGKFMLKKLEEINLLLFREQERNTPDAICTIPRISEDPVMILSERSCETASIESKTAPAYSDACIRDHKMKPHGRVTGLI